MNYFSQVKNFVDTNPHLIFPEAGATDDMLVHIKNTLKLEIKGEYLKLITNWGTLMLNGSRYSGYDGVFHYIGTKMSKLIYTVIDHTQNCRNQGFDNKYIAFVSIEGDEFLCLDPSIDGLQPIFRWDYFQQQMVGQVSESLFELIWDDINECVIPTAKREGNIVNL